MKLVRDLRRALAHIERARGRCFGAANLHLIFKLVGFGFGEERPVADNSTPDGRAQNRRMVFTVLAGGDHVRNASDGTK